MRSLVSVLLLSLTTFTGSLPLLSADPDSGHYALILSDPPVAESFPSPKSMRNSAARDYRQQIRTAQASLRRDITRRNVPVTGSVQSLLNAVFVRASRDQVESLRGLPGVRDVVPLPRLHLKLDKAVPLVNGQAAWTALGGVGNAGAGMKIAIIDSGIDHTHPAFHDDSLLVPAGFPKCQPDDCPFTNRKVIVARSYVRQLAVGTPPNPAADSRPDDLSPRDRVGHGTAVAMSAAGWTNTGPQGTITGVAPKAYLGNYKVFGSPGVNDGTSGGAMISALEDALDDGMDVAVLSLGGPAFFGPLDQGQTCGLSRSTPCDPVAHAVENAVQAGMSVVVAAGNEGGDGEKTPTMSTISSPGTAPSAITVGASTNSHIFTSSVRVPGSDVPDNLRLINAFLGDGLLPSEPLTAPLRDVSQLGNDGLACSDLTPDSLTGAIALIQRGTCLFLIKVGFAQNAGAVGVVFYQVDGEDALIRPGGLAGTRIPAMMISNTNGQALKSFLASHPDAPVTLDPALTALDSSTFDTMAGFSSRGPATGTSTIKPDLVAVGTSMYMATQRFDPNGRMYDPSGYTVAQGTSFATPMVAGAAALAKQKNPGLPAAQLKSLLVNTATQNITESGATAGIFSQGAGKLNAGAVLDARVTVEPAILTFGVLSQGSLPAERRLSIRNVGNSALNLALSVEAAVADSNPQLTLDRSNLSLIPELSSGVITTLSGSLPAPGVYRGTILIQGGGTALRVPYTYVVADGVPFNIIPLAGSGFVGVSGEPIPTRILAFKLIDQFGAPVQGTPVEFRASLGGGSIQNTNSQTDAHGIAAALPVLGPTRGPQRFVAEAGGLTLEFNGTARLRPTINTDGVVNAASFEVGPGAAPGSYISIFGSALSDTIQSALTAYLPLSIARVSVSFDVPSANLSLPGRLHVVAPGQVNVQVPRELHGQNSALLKVSIGRISTELYQMALSEYSPGVFERLDPSSGGQFAAALDENNRVIGADNPAPPGRPIQVFLNGLGPVDNEPPTGEPTPLQPLSRTLAIPEVAIAGRKATVEFSGLAPLFAGLYQVNVVVPPDTPPGTQPLVITINGSVAKAVNLPVE